MKTYKFEVTQEQKEAIYTALCHATREEYQEEVYTPELLYILDSPSLVIELTIDQLGAALRGLEKCAKEPELNKVHKFEEVHHTIKGMSRKMHKLIC